MSKIETVADLVKRLLEFPQDKPVRALLAHDGFGTPEYGYPRVEEEDEEGEDCPVGTVLVYGMER